MPHSIPSAILVLLSLIGGVSAASSREREQPQSSAEAAPLTVLHGFALHGAPQQVLEASDGTLYGVTSLDRLFRITSSGDLNTWQPFTHGVFPAPIKLVEAGDGNIYGIANFDGATGRGTIFRVSSSGVRTVLYTFQNGLDGWSPTDLITSSDGHLYGISRGGANDRGTLFKITASGVFTTLYAFTSNEARFDPPTELIDDNHGDLYMSSAYGGPNGKGALLKATRSGVVSIVYNFPGENSNGSCRPRAMAKGSDGNFYVAHEADMEGSWITAISRITPAGLITEVHRLPKGLAVSDVVTGSDGYVYGAVAFSYSVPESRGFLFRFSSGSGFEILYNFDGTNAADPRSLVVGADGALRGVASGGPRERGIVFRFSVAEQLTILSDFNDGIDGYEPISGLARAADGTIYGTTFSGGPLGEGTIYKRTPDGQVTTIYGFETAADGGRPFRLVLSGDGNLYGATSQIGQTPPILFRLTPSGNFTALDSTPPGPGTFTNYKLIEGRDGAVYGTRSNGGANQQGTVFKIGQDGVVTTIHNFSGGTNGWSPDSLVHATDGNLYGVTLRGGEHGFGTVFRLTPAGVLTILKSYPFSIFSPRPPNALVQGSDGNLYGMLPLETLVRNQYTPATLFRMALNGDATTIHTFVADNSGSPPPDPKGLVAGRNGKLHGITNKYIFSSTFSGDVTKVYVFNRDTDGDIPSDLLQGYDENLYGTLSRRGPAGGGSIYQLSLPKARFLNLSTRARVLSGDGALIAGFIVTGLDAKTVIVRGIGPSLEGSGVAGALQNPTLELFDASGASLAFNDDWKENQTEIGATGIPPGHDLESAIVRILSPGAYTVALRGKNATTGVGLLEVYDLTGAGDSTLANMSTRGAVETGNNVMIGGFIVGGESGNITRTIVRAIGPSLSAAGVSDPLQDPILSVHDANGSQLGLNDNWREGQQPEVAGYGLSPTDDREAALYLSLAPGQYTTIVRGANDSTGVGLVEAYNVN